MLVRHSTGKFLSLLLTPALLLMLSGCGSKPAVEEAPAASVPGKNQQSSDSGPQVTPTTFGNSTVNAVPLELPDNSEATETRKPEPEVVISTSVGDIRVRLFINESPVTVENFLYNYVDTGFYEGTILHYADESTMVMGGGYTADLQAKTTRSEIFNEAHNGLKNKRGTIAMARHPSYPQSATSQFFFNVNDNTNLDHVGSEEGQEYGYCVFGQIVEGQEIVDAIAKAPVQSAAGFPRVPSPQVVIKSVHQVKKTPPANN